MSSPAKRPTPLPPCRTSTDPAVGLAKATGTDNVPVQNDGLRAARIGGEEARKNLALCLALPHTFPRAGMHQDALETELPRDAESIGRPLEKLINCCPQDVLAGVAELADAQDSKS
jgi:hypothetical protein